MSNSTTTHVSFPVGGLLGVLFIALKLTGVINWSWLWVLAPFWIPLALTIIFLVLFLGIVMVAKK